MLTRYKDTDTLILDQLPDLEILKFCKLSKGTQAFCNEDFFRRRSWNLYPDMARYKDKLQSTKEMTWKDYFLSIVYFREIILKEFNYNLIEGNPEIVYIILDKSRRMNADIGLNLAAKYGYKSLARYFLLHGASLYNNTPKRTAQRYGHDEITSYLSTL